MVAGATVVEEMLQKETAAEKTKASALVNYDNFIQFLDPGTSVN